MGSCFSDSSKSENNCRAKADYLAKIGDKDGATAAYALTEKKTAGAAQKLDLVFSLMRSGPYRDI